MLIDDEIMAQNRNPR